MPRFVWFIHIAGVRSGICDVSEVSSFDVGWVRRKVLWSCKQFKTALPPLRNFDYANRPPNTVRG